MPFLRRSATPRRRTSLAEPSPEARFRIPIILLAIVFIAGPAGYVLIEGWNLGDALYMTLITVATVGFGEIHPLSGAGRLHTSFLIVAGIGTLLFTLWAGLEYLVAGHLGRRLERRRMERSVAKLASHYIICGYGRVGQEVAAEFRREGIPFVVVDITQSSLERAKEDGHTIVLGDATKDETLREARIERARGLVAAVANDADNVYVVLSAKELAPGLFVVARSNSEEAEPKLRRAGADRVISPYVMGGRRMAMLAVRPIAVDFVDLALHGQDVELVIEQLVVDAGSRLDGATVLEVRQMFGEDVVVLALERDKLIQVNPLPSTRCAAGDGLVVFGSRVLLQSQPQQFKQKTPNERPGP